VRNAPGGERSSPDPGEAGVAPPLAARRARQVLHFHRLLSHGIVWNSEVENQNSLIYHGIGKNFAVENSHRLPISHTSVSERR
jgi:hypothetical protein